MLFGKNLLTKSFLLGLFLIVLSPFVFAATASNTENMEKTQTIAGYWQTIDGKTKKPSSVIQIAPNGQFYEGKIVKTFSAHDANKPNVCVACKGDQKDKPILGLTIIKNMVCKPQQCSKGTVLDPRDGKIYHATMKLANNGQQLRVRGYVGVPIFGKSVVWNRVSSLK